MIMNVHSLLHLKEDVKRRGPLGINSCFPIENFNSMLNIFLQTANESFFFRPDIKKKKNWLNLKYREYNC